MSPLERIRENYRGAFIVIMISLASFVVLVRMLRSPTSNEVHVAELTDASDRKLAFLSSIPWSLPAACLVLANAALRASQRQYQGKGHLGEGGSESQGEGDSGEGESERLEGEHKNHKLKVA